MAAKRTMKTTHFTRYPVGSYKFILVLHRALPDLQRMKHKPEQHHCIL